MKVLTVFAHPGNASSEIEYRQTWGRLIGEEGQGIRVIIDMVHHTRFDTALAAAVFLVIADVDPLKSALMAFAFAAATFFPALLLAIWWPRCTRWGATTALAAGFAVMVTDALFGKALGFFGAGFSAPLASLTGVVLALITGIAASYAQAAPSKVEADYREAMRNPDGDAVYDRAQARAAAAAASAAARAEQVAATESSR